MRFEFVGRVLCACEVETCRAGVFCMGLSCHVTLDGVHVKNSIVHG